MVEKGSSGSGVFELDTNGLMLDGVVGVNTYIRGPNPNLKWTLAPDQIYPLLPLDQYVTPALREAALRQRRFPNMALFFTAATRNKVIEWIDAI